MFPLPSERVDFAGIDGNGYPEFISAIYHISFSAGQWVLVGFGGSFIAHSDDALSDEYITDAGIGSVSVVLTLACKGLLIEEQRTNSMSRSNEFGGVLWIKEQATIIENVKFSPQGLVDADKLTPTTLNTNHDIYQSVLVSAGPITGSVFVKAGGYDFATLTVVGTAVRHAIVVDLTTGLITKSQSTGSPSGVATSSVSLGGGWWRIAVTLTATAGAGFVVVGAAPTSTVTFDAFLNPTFAGDGTSGIFIFGAQLEAGADATSYIPTVASSAIRSADVCSITGTAFTGLWNATEGTLFTTASTSVTAGSKRILAATDGSSSNRYVLFFDASGANATKFLNSSGGSVYTNILVTTTSVASPTKMIGAYKLNDFAYVVNGSAVATNTSGLVGTGIDRFTIGNQNNIEFLNGHIQSIRYYKKRLSNSKLQTLTT